MKIPITKIELNETDIRCVIDVLQSGWIVQGKKVKEFEDRWSGFTKAKYSIAISNCSTAINLSLAALNVGFGDEVIVPSFTWIATANSVETLGAKPVFCDIDLKSFNIDVSKIERKINSKTKAIIPVHLFGLSADMDAIINIAKKYNLYIIEDAACGFGAKYNNKHVGNFGDTGCFSFHPRKAITTGEGGIITTNNEKLAEKLRSMRDHGAERSDMQRHFGNKPYLLPDFPYAGFNYRMTDIQASLACSQMKRAEEILIKRKEIAGKYNKFIDNIEYLSKPLVEKKYIHSYQSFVCLFNPEKINLDNLDNINKKRNNFMEYLQKNGISTRPGTHAVHLLKYYSEKYNLNKEDFINSYIADRCSITFPLYPTMTDEEFNYIKETIKRY